MWEFVILPQSLKSMCISLLSLGYGMKKKEKNKEKERGSNELHGRHGD
jgi:hypothetical protein